MPGGIPVATVGINNAKNAGLLAIAILGASNPQLLDKIQQYRDSLAEIVLEKQANLDQVGYQRYLKEVNNDH
jgi:5-(carboxyamino)imidazole ribonucleotide mutase